jgi:hypothetical protein
VVRRQTLGEAGQVLDEPVLLAVDADQQVEGQGVVGRRLERAGMGVVAVEPGIGEIRRRRGRGRQPLQRLGDPAQGLL